MTPETPIAYLKLKSAEARKLGRTGGPIQFMILADVERLHLYLTISGNPGGGYYSTEAVAFDAIETALPIDNAPFPAKVFSRCFKGRSTNNPGFLAAILRSLDLLQPVLDKPHLHVVAGDWSTWKASMLALPGVPYAPGVKVAVASTPAPTSTSEQSTVTDALSAQVVTAEDDQVDLSDQAEIIQAVTTQPEPIKGRRKPGKLKDPEYSHPSQSEASDHAHPA
jgi:hypothetical protein